MKKPFHLSLLLVLTLLCCGCGSSLRIPAASAQETEAIDTKDMDLSFSDRDLEGTWDQRSTVLIQGNGSTAEISGKGAAFKDGTLTISSEGVYRLTGVFTDIAIVVDAGSKDKVQFVLDDASVTNANGPALFLRAADKVFLTLPEGTDSTLTDGSTYEQLDGETVLDAAVFSRTDLTINGTGTLRVNGQYKHGIVSKDDLRICGATVHVNAVSTALDGKDCVKMTGAAVNVTAGSNGIRSDNTEDAQRGFVYLSDCTLDITAGSDGIQAQTLLRSDNSNVTVMTGEGSGYSLRYAEGSWKGLKSGTEMLLTGGSFRIDSQDDCLHTNGDLTITSGDFILSSGDDGVHADGTATLAGGSVLVTKSYEGFEASHIIISGGKLDITASDDGLNAAGGADGSAMGGRFGRGMFSNGIGEIEITGGYVVINASGDGIDSNGTINVSGGVTLVSGPTNSGNAAFDYDGSAAVTGGTLIAAGPSGMAQNFSSAENQGAMLVSFAPQQRGESIALTDAEGLVLAAYSPVSDYQCAVITAPGIQQGQTYTLISGGTVNGADEHGFAQNTTVTDGTSIGQITMDTLLFGGSGGFGGGRGMPGGWFGNPGGNRMEPPNGGVMPDDMPEIPEGGTMPDDMPEIPEGGKMPDDVPALPGDGTMPGGDPWNPQDGGMRDERPGGGRWR